MVEGAEGAEGAHSKFDKGIEQVL
ncbi:unnamed protein product, partial [Rotaria sp. Silwood1]